MKSYSWTFVLVLLVDVDCILTLMIASQVSVVILFVVFSIVCPILLIMAGNLDAIDASIEKSMALKEMKK